MNPSKSGAASKVSIHRHNAQIKFPKLNQFTERRSKTDIQNTHQIKLYMILKKKKTYIEKLLQFGRRLKG